MVSSLTLIQFFKKMKALKGVNIERLRYNYFAHDYAINNMGMNCRHALINTCCCCYSDSFLAKKLEERYTQLKHLLETIYYFKLPILFPRNEFVCQASDRGEDTQQQNGKST